MCNNSEEIKCQLVTFAESVRGKSVFDLNFNIDISEFFHIKFINDQIEKQKLCNSIYKYSI